VARIEDGSQTNTRLQGRDDNSMNFVVNDVASLLIVDRIDDFVSSVFLVAI